MSTSSRLARIQTLARKNRLRRSFLRNSAPNEGRSKCKSSLQKSKSIHFQAMATDDLLAKWLNFPIKENFLGYNLFMLSFKWLLWTSRSMISLDPDNNSIRERLSNTISVISTAAGLFLVVAMTCLVTPPEPTNDTEKLIINIYGICMYASSTCFSMYVCFVLIGLYPMIQSLRDDMAFQAFERFTQRWGGYELYFFNAGLHGLQFGLLLISIMFYSFWAVMTMVGIFFVCYGLVLHFCKEMFLALDPISAMHLGLSNDPNDVYRAEIMSRYLKKHTTKASVDDLSHHAFDEAIELKRLRQEQGSGGDEENEEGEEEQEEEEEGQTCVDRQDGQANQEAGVDAAQEAYESQRSPAASQLQAVDLVL